jgi:hypothetical protein
MSTAEFGPLQQTKYAERRDERDVPEQTVETLPNSRDRAHEAMRRVAVANSVEQPERSRVAEWLLSRRNRAIASIAAISLGGVLVGCGAEASGSSERVAPDTKTSAPATPGDTLPNGDTDTRTDAEYYPTVYDTDLYASLDAEAQHEVQLLEEMSYDSFRLLDYPRQAAYGEFYFRAYQEYGEEQAERSPYYRGDTPDTTDKNSTGQQIVNLFAKQQATLFYSASENGNPYHISEENREEVKKALSYLYPQLAKDSTAYTNAVEQVGALESLEADQDNPNNGDGYKVFDVDRESAVGNAFGVAYGNNIKYINRRNQDGSVSQYVYEYNSFDTIEGDKKFDQWQLALVVGESSPLFKPDVESLFK